MATIKDIAKKSGFSISTVSYALSDDPKIPDKTKQKIKEIAKELNYVPNAFARGLKNKSNKNIGVFLPGFKGPVHPAVLSGIGNVIEQKLGEYKLIVTLMDEYLKLINEKFVDVAIILDSRLTDDKIIEISKTIPVLLFDKIVENKNIYNTYIENKKGIYERVVRLYNSGHRKFMFISGSNASFYNKERLEGFTEAIKNCNLDLNNQIILEPNSFTEEAGYNIIKSYLENHELDVECIVCSNDELAIGCIKALKIYGIVPPNKVKVSGFDDIEIGKYIQPPLSTTRVDYVNYGEELAKLAINILEGKKDKTRINISTTLIDREST